ncbi:hypothetical protein KIF24_24320 [Micromonospora sp. Llam7]|uniref:ADP-ribosylglycohydrolase family protein n=1 Tax=Micromonospora tarapacensis TaxID=2835305 RepID=UPI001C83B515|nr:ADP-ribosylglycohydrolase family protein [Micromonospora tarapacensis]MBX7268839.1 hypothetical protein [Micromonospora tarapacensis]
MTSTGLPMAQLRDRSRGCLIAAVHRPPTTPTARLPATWPTGPLDQPAARVVAHARHLAAYPDTCDEPPSYVEGLMAALTVAWGWNDAAARGIIRDGVHLLCAVPAGLLPGPLGDLGRRARLACAVLGGDATAQQASMVVAYAVAMAYRAASTRKVDRFDFCYRLAHLAADDRLAERLARVAALGDRDPDQAAAHLLADGSDRDRVSIGVAAFLRHPAAPDAAAPFAATVADPPSAGIAAALAGAYAGTAALPHTWLRDTTRTAAISDASDALVALASRRQTLRSC